MRTATALVACLLASSAAAQPADPPAGPGSMAHRPVADGAGALLTWLEPTADGGAWALRCSRFNGEAWSDPATIRTGDDFFANWADLPAAHRAPDGSIVASWLQKSGPGTYAYDIILARSVDGEAWALLGAAHDDGTQTEHGFVSMVDDPNGVRLFWLDGRNMTGGHGGGAPSSMGGHGGAGDMTIRTGVLTAGGEVAQSIMLDPRTCECCATDGAMTSSGPVVVYRDRSETEIRDIAIVRADGDSWTPPAPVATDNWRMPACPVNGPAIDADGRDVVVAWYTGARGGMVQCAFSENAGADFRAPLRVAMRGDDGAPLGRVDVVLLSSGDAVVTWLGAGGEVLARRAKPNGWQGPVRTLATTASSRAAGFPKLVPIDGERLLLTWTDVDGDATRVRAAVVETP